MRVEPTQVHKVVIVTGLVVCLLNPADYGFLPGMARTLAEAGLAPEILLEPRFVFCGLAEVRHTFMSASALS